MKVYVVTTGWYSDYSIIGVYTSQEKAEEYLKLHNKESLFGSRIEIFEANKPNSEKINYYQFEYTRDYKFEKCSKYNGYHYDPVVREEEITEWADAYHMARKTREIICFDVYAEDEDKAKKIAQDRIAEYKYRKEVEEKE